MAARKPLRVALIGLSSAATGTSWAAAAHLPSLLTSTGRSKYTITALLNSSVDAAKSAIKAYNLSSDTKAYGSPIDLAQDPDIDVVICNTRVDKHYETILPSIQSGKDVYVEWPIASNLTQTNEILEATRKSGSRVAVGLQRRWLPPVLKVKEIIAEGKLGKVLSSEARAYGGLNDRQSIPPGIKYFTDRVIGGNMVTIGLAHALDLILSVVGDFIPESVHSKAQLQRPVKFVKDNQTGEIIETVRSNVPDLVSVHGSLAPSAYTDPSATLTFLYRLGQPFPGTSAFTWSINCEFGEVRLVAPGGAAMERASAENPVKVEIHHFDTDEVKNVTWDWSDLQKEVPAMGMGVQSCLYAFADGAQEGEGWVGIEDAARRAELIEGFLTSWEEDTAAK